MSLISRIQISNYLTEGINASRRIADWRPMIHAITLRMDSKSALLNLTNGGGKTSIADLVLYLLSRDARLLQRIREKCSPRERGFTHARVEFRDTVENGFVTPALLAPDPLNLPGQTYVVGVVLNDKAEEEPVFYVYSGTLEDSPCYELANGIVTLVPDARFVEKTKSLRGCTWNKHTTKSAWQDAISLHISTDVLRRNVKYQCEGSDDKNAQFFAFAPRGGETYDEAFFRAVVAPDLLTNILSTWAEEGEQSIEDTLYLSLSQIVKTDDEIAKKDLILKRREAQLSSLQPLLELGGRASEAQSAVRVALQDIRKDAALGERFGAHRSRDALPGIPKSLDSLVTDQTQDPRVMQALRGMFLSADGNIMIFADVVAEIVHVDTAQINRTMERKRIWPSPVSSQVIDFTGYSANLRIGTRGGGVARKGYPREAALQIPDLIQNVAGAQTDGLAAALALAFDIAETQIDTNPASIQLRGLESEGRRLKVRVAAIQKEDEILRKEDKHLQDQITSRSDNRASWEEFQENNALLPEELRMAPLEGKRWLEQRQQTLREESNANLVRHTTLADKWQTYVDQLRQAGLGGMESVRQRHDELIRTRAEIAQQDLEIASRRKTLAQQLHEAAKVREAVQARKFDVERELSTFDRLQPGYARFRSVFGAVNPHDVNPEGDVKKARVKRDKVKDEVEKVRSELAEKCALQSTAGRYGELFGEADPRTHNPIAEERKWREQESQAQQSAVRLLEKVEAIDNFGALFPGQQPDQWLAHADRRRDELASAIRALQGEMGQAQRELDAIARMSVVDDGHYAVAWKALREACIPCERLAEVLVREGAGEVATRAAMSAMSGLLPAPVFGTHDALVQAADLLASLNVAVPLIARDELISALHASSLVGSDVYLAGFVAGPYSRAARILLEPDYAESENQRLTAAILACERQIAARTVERLSFRTDSQEYKLATLAADGMRGNAPALYQSYCHAAEEARRNIDVLKAQTTDSALSILRAAKAYFEFGGDAALGQLRERLDQRQAEFTEMVEPALADAEAKASQGNLMALADAIAYVDKGEEEGHLTLRRSLQEAAHAVEEAALRAEELEMRRMTLEEAQDALARLRAAFEGEGGEEQIRRIGLAVEMDDDAEGRAFMAAYDKASRDLEEAEGHVRRALQVNFERAQIFRNNMHLPDEEIAQRRTQIAATLANLKTEADAANVRLDVIDVDERPPLIVAARAIQELAGEAMRLALKMQTAIEATQTDFPEIAFTVEAHPHYAVFNEICHRLRSHDVGHEVLECVAEMKEVLHAIHTDDAAQSYLNARKTMTEALTAFEKAKRAYCESAREHAASDDMALNALEVDEIERSDVTRLQALTSLFASLKDSIEKDKQAALLTRESAEAAHQTAIDALARLIGNAESNLATMDKVMKRYPKGRFFIKAEVVGEDRIKEILTDLKDEVARQFRASGTSVVKRSDEGTIKARLKSTLIKRVFLQPSVEFVNAAIWNGQRDVLKESQSTGQKVALQFMWIVRQAEFEIERRLLDMGRSQAKKERSSANRLIIIDGIFSSLSNRKLIKEAMSGLRDLGGNFQIIGLLHSETWVNNYDVFPVYLVGRKLQHGSGDEIIAFEEGRQDGTLAVFSSFAKKHPTADDMAA